MNWNSNIICWSMQRVIEKENNFKEPGERYRSWAPDRYLYCSIVIKYMDDIYVSCMSFLMYCFFCISLVIFSQARKIHSPMG